MFKIWLKTLNGDKIFKSKIFEFEGNYTANAFYKNITEICEKSDIPVPMVLGRHQAHFERFNIVRFKPSDFVESVGFTCMVLEFVPEEKTKKS